MHILPGQFVDMPREEKAFVMASIDAKIKAEKKEAAKTKMKRK